MNNEALPNHDRRYNWYAQNLANISRRLEWLRNTPDGVVLQAIGNDQNTESILVVKDREQVLLYFIDNGSSRVRSAIMSRIDMYDPLLLIDTYAQAMMLSLVLNDKPENVYVLGFGGGRIPMIFHHYFPAIVVEGAEQNLLVVSIMSRFFGLKQDSRIKIAVNDGRDHLSGMTNSRYDIIMVDCETVGVHQSIVPSRGEFYGMCKSRLTERGVIAVNLLNSHPLFASNVNSLQALFKTTYAFVHHGACVFLGTDAVDYSESEFIINADQIAREYEFHFPFVERAMSIKLRS